MDDFLMMRTLIAPRLVAIVWMVGTVLISLGAFYWAGQAFHDTGNIGWLLAAVFLVLVGNTAWRLLSEAVVVAFGIHDSLRAIERHFTAHPQEADESDDDAASELLPA